MSSRKKQKTSECVKDEESVEHSESLHLPSTSKEHIIFKNSKIKYSFNFSCLPSEIILLIYNFLTPVDLLTMAEIGNQRLRDLTFYVDHANFSFCYNTNNQNISSYFCRRRVSFLKQLNLNYNRCFKPQLLIKLICRCKNLKELSIVGCGICYEDLVTILQSCPLIEKLAWNINDLFAYAKAVSPSIKYVNLFFWEILPLRYIYWFLGNFPNVENVWIHFDTGSSVTTSPFTGVFLNLYSVTNSELTKRYILVWNVLAPRPVKNVRNVITFFNGLIKVGFEQDPEEEPRYDDKYFPDNPSTFMFSTYSQIKSSIQDIPMLLSSSCNVFSSLCVILTPEILNVSENLLKSIAHAAGAKLKELSLKTEQIDIDKREDQRSISNEVSLIICDVLEKIVVTSKYITDLNLITIHFTIVSPFKAISKLKFLESLSIPSCAYLKLENVDKASFDEEYIEFKDVVEKCILVNSFSLAGCCDDYDRLLDIYFNPLQSWKELKCLSIYLISLMSYTFLGEVAKYCKKLESLSLVELQPKDIQIYYDDLIYAVQKAKSLTFLRINETTFNPRNNDFWKAIGDSLNLEGICIRGDSLQSLAEEPLDAIKKLKYLQLFHFDGNIRQLCPEIKKSVHENCAGHCDFKLRHKCNSFFSPPSTDQPKQLFHFQPVSFCQCQHF